MDYLQEEYRKVLKIAITTIPLFEHTKGSLLLKLQNKYSLK